MVYFRISVRSAGKFYGLIYHTKEDSTVDKEERIDGTFEGKTGRNMG